MSGFNSRPPPRLWGKDPWEVFMFLLGTAGLIHQELFRDSPNGLTVGACLALMAVPLGTNLLALLRRNGRQ